MTDGEILAWERLLKADPQIVCSGAAAEFDVKCDCYKIKSFGMEVTVSLEDKNRAGQTVCSLGEQSPLCLSKHFMFALLWYLTSAKDIPLSGILISPEEVSGGQLFIKGSHRLPLDDISNRYDNDIEGFISKGMSLNGERTGYTDASIRLFPFPRIPVDIILWRGDEEFPPKTVLLFDLTSQYHAPVDVLWSIAMMCIQAML